MEFQDVIDECNLRDMGYIGEIFTWRGRIRGLINEYWAQIFPHGALENLEFSRYDHRPLLVNTDYFLDIQMNNQGQQPKRFEARWLREKYSDEVVKKAWERAGHSISPVNVFDKLSRVHNQFHDWD